MQRPFLPLLGALLLATNANAVLVDFESDVIVEEWTAGPYSLVQGDFPVRVHTQGFTFGLKNDYSDWYGQVFDIGTSPVSGNYLSGYTEGFSQPNSIWRDDGQLFSIASLDLSNIFVLGTYYGLCPAVCYSYNEPVVIRGYDASGALSNSLSVFAESSTSTAWQTVSFDTSWTNLSYVEIIGQEQTSFFGFPRESTTPSLDNFNASVVPIPGAVWLFASALGLMGWRSRRH